MMRTSNLVIWLSSLIVVLALVAASIGLFWQDGGSSFTFTTLRGDTVSIAGQGLYHYDTTLVAMGFKAGDAVTLVLGIPTAIDMGIIAPALIVAGVLLLRTNPIGFSYLLSSTLLVFTVILGINLLTAGTMHLF
jgi:hypothetical protein